MTNEAKVAAAGCTLRDLLTEANIILDDRVLSGRLPRAECKALAKRADAIYAKPSMSRVDQRRAFALDAVADYSNHCREPGEDGRRFRRMPFVVWLCSRAGGSDAPPVRAIGRKLMPLADKLERAQWPSAKTKAA